jgi:23S rRNA (guanosine2251-2'-O)-methyltransferase
MARWPVPGPPRSPSGEPPTTTPPTLYGFHPVREALRHRPHEVARILVLEGRHGPRLREIEDLARRHRIELAVVEEAQLRGLAGEAHNGFVAELSPAPGVSPAGAPGRDPGLVVLLEDVQDPRNLGAVLRVCEAAGVGRVLLRDRGSAPLTPTVAKSSAGATEWVELERIGNSALEIERLKAQGYWVYGAAVDGELPWKVDLTGPLALCFGGEERGLRTRTRSLCDRLVGLPMRGRVGSLNLATAAAALLFEAVRQRSDGGA